MVCLVGKGGKGTSKLLCLQATGSVLWSHSYMGSLAQMGCWREKAFGSETKEEEAEQMLGERSVFYSLLF